MSSAVPVSAATAVHRLDIGDLFAGLTTEHRHERWFALLMTRDFTDPGACPLCRAGWCVQRLVLRPGEAAEVVHGLPMH